MMTGSNVAFCGMVCLIRYASSLNIQTTTLFRFIVGLGVVGALAMAGRARLTFVNKPGLFLRGLMGGVAVWMCYVSIAQLGLIKSSLIGYTYPVFATLFSALYLKEKIRLGKALCLFGACFGIGMVMLASASASGKSGVAPGFGYWEAFALAGAMIGGLTIVLVKKLQDTDSTESIFFSQCLVGFWIVIVPATAAPSDIGYHGCALLLAIGLLAAVGQLVMTEGFRYISVSSGSVITLLSPVLTVAVGAILFHESFPPLSMAGAVILLASSGLSVVSDMNK
jgi:drug/metabolite transporter (DMT)-like permease